MKNLALSLLFISVVCSISSCTSGTLVVGQQDPSKARERAHKALALEEDGNFGDAIDLLEEARSLDTTEIGYPYELGLAYMQNRDYRKALACLEPLKNRPAVFDLVFQALGNCYDDMGEPARALAMYDEGLEKFPKSGKLYVEKGVVYWKKNDLQTALKNFEKGIAVEPRFPSNYYRAAILFCTGSEAPMWGMLYGEIFMNLEPNSKRSATISKLLYEAYEKGIRITSDTTKTISFCKTPPIDANEISNPAAFKLPFGSVYEMTMSVAAAGERSIDVAALDRIRTKFIGRYFEHAFDKTYPNVLFEYHRTLLQAGYFEAYNRWALRGGDETGFDNWRSSHKEKWENFVRWISKNPIPIDNAKNFIRSQY